MKILIRIMLLSILVITGVTFTLSFTDKYKHPKMKYLPEDMVLIKAAEPFYISNHLTTNKEYMTYLIWINNVFVDYPNVVLSALPDSNQWKTQTFNEPYTQSYLFHPAYEEYPVLGVSWIQAEQFCRWKTDRLNEYTLMQEGYFTKENYSTNENNFNTEAWMFGQYEGIISESVHNTKFPFYPITYRIMFPNVRQYIFHDSLLNELYQKTYRCLTGDSLFLYNPAQSFLFSHFRLPTENELELYYESQSVANQKSSSFLNWYFKQPFYGKMPNSDFINSYPTIYNNIDTVFVEYKKNVHTFTPYPVIQYEWAFEMFSIDKKNKPLLSLYSDNKQKQGGLYVSGVYPELLEKDSLGRMKSFYILKNNKNGFAVPMENYKPDGVYAKRIIRSKQLRDKAQEQYGYGNIGFRVTMCAD